MKDLNTAALLQILQAPLMEWRRLPVKHPSQVPQRNHVIAAIEELCSRLTEADSTVKVLKEQNTDLEVSSLKLDKQCGELEKQNNIFVKEIGSLQSQLADQVRNNSFKDNKITLLEAKICKYDFDIAGHREDADSFLATLSSKQDLIGRLEKRLETAHNDIKKYKSLINQMQSIAKE